MTALVSNPITTLYDARRITPGDPEWPDQLDQLDPPVRELWISGTGNLREALATSIVVTGARASTNYGNTVAAEIAGELAAKGWTVITGGSFGIDAAATRAALTGTVPTVIVAGSGLNHIHPVAHTDLFASVLAAGGLIISAQAPDARGLKAGFERRNQLLGVLASGVVIVEAARRSGTSRIVDTAEAMGAPVFAVPGPVTSMVSAYPHKLIREDRAILTTNAADILEEYGQ